MHIYPLSYPLVHIYIHTFIVMDATNFTPRCLPAIYALYLPSKHPDTINRPLAMNELHTHLPEKPWKEDSLSWLQFICFQTFLLWEGDISQDLVNKMLKFNTEH